jgi:hypothetical protein
MQDGILPAMPSSWPRYEETLLLSRLAADLRLIRPTRSTKLERERLLTTIRKATDRMRPAQVKGSA